MPHARYHLIGHLQSNKARIAVTLFDVIQTVDSPKLLKRLNDVAGEQGKQLQVLLEIKLSDEASKTGRTPGTFRLCFNPLPGVKTSGSPG